MNCRCDVWNGMRDLKNIAEYAFSKRKQLCLHARGLGAYFNVNAFAACYLTVLETSGYPFMDSGDEPIVTRWLDKSI